MSPQAIWWAQLWMEATIPLAVMWWAITLGFRFVRRAGW